MGRKHDSLAEYRKKRSPERSPEPGGPQRTTRTTRRPRFVVQKHDATTLHYDFRLQAGGVLKSWAIPKGPSLKPKDKRLAMPTEDHPVDYADFEGVIPEGEYGAGPVIVWDRGTYRNLSGKDGRKITVERAIEAGHLKVWLQGEKLVGGFALTRAGGGKRARWFLVKMNDEWSDGRRNPVSTEQRSVQSGKTIEQLAEEARPRGG